MALQWQDSYCVNFCKIDLQHKKLFAIGESLYIMASQGCLDDGCKESLMTALGELKDYAGYHFDYEEQFIESHGYLQIEKHREEHLSFIRQIEVFHQELQVAPNQEAVLKIILYIVNWVTYHILLSDKAYSKELIKKGVIDTY